MPRQRGRRGAGSITRRGGKFQAQWSTTEGGKRIRKTATFALRNEAEWWLREAGRTGVTPDVGETVAEYLERWLATKRGIAPSTRLSYENHVREHIVPVLGSIAIGQLLPRHVEGLIKDRLAHVSAGTGRPLTPSTVRSILTTLRMALAQGVKRREIPDNAAADVSAPRVRRDPVRAVSAAEMKRIRAALEDTWLEPVARFLFGSALRISEALTLNQGDIDWERSTVRLRASKTTIRTVMVTQDGMAALREAIAGAPRRGKAEPIFFSPRPNRAGVRDRLSRHSVSHALPRILERAGVDRLTPHGLRHGHATVALEAGIPIEIIAQQLGHANPTMTRNVYAHVLPAMKRSALDTVDEAVAKR